MPAPAPSPPPRARGTRFATSMGMPTNPVALLSDVVNMVNDGEMERAEHSFSPIYDALRATLHPEEPDDRPLLEALDFMREALDRGNGAAFHEAHDLFDDALAVRHTPLAA